MPHLHKGGVPMKERKEEYWSKFARTFEADQEYIIGKGNVQVLIRKLHEERDLKEVIEFGCGTGRFTKEIARNAKHILATDLSDEMLELAKVQLNAFPNVTVQKADCWRTSFRSARFDTVFMVNVIHVIENPSDALRESYRILRNGGKLLIASGTNYGAKESDIRRRVTRYLKVWGMPPSSYQTSLSPDGLASLVESAGFAVDVVEHVKLWLYLKATKK
jgi:ABC-2 type transport system ATP-binding protein